jgi:hypothetical protein
VEDALSRLHRAIDYALLATVSGSSQQRGALHARLARALATQGAMNSEDEMPLLPNYERFVDVLPILVRGEDGKRALHPVWNAADFIAPAVAALAILFDRTLDPHGASRLVLTVSRQPSALYGYRLEALSAAAPSRGADPEPPHPMADADWMHVSVILAGAALAFVKEISVMRFAPCYLRAQAERAWPPGSEAPAPEGRPAPVSLASSSLV